MRILNIIIILLLELYYIILIESKNRGGAVLDRIWRNKRIQCEKFDCNYLLIDEAMNCINNCTSTLCYKEIYGESPLEDGEIDERRNRAFTSCLRRETKNMRKQTNTVD